MRARLARSRLGRASTFWGCTSKTAYASRSPAELLLLLAVVAFDAADPGESEDDQGSEHASRAGRKVGPTQSRTTWAVYFNWLNSAQHFRKVDQYVTFKLRRWLQAKHERRRAFWETPLAYWREAGLYSTRGRIAHTS
jgi:hypothetical protein